MTPQSTTALSDLTAFVASDRAWYVHHSDVLAGLRELPDACVQMVCTSPPYFQLRDYGVPGQVGLERTPEAFVARLVDIFHELRRVLRDDGVLFCNIADSYAGSGKGPSNSLQRPASSLNNRQLEAGAIPTEWVPLGSKGARIGSVNGESGHTSGVTPPPGLKPKDLNLIPERLAIAMQADGWWVRSRIAWCKKAPMPGSMTDRPTSAWETIWLFSKARRYFWDADAVRVPWADERRGASETKSLRYSIESGRRDTGLGPAPSTNGRNLWNYWDIPEDEAWLLGPEPLRGMEHYAAFPTEIPRRCILAGSREGDLVLDPFAGTSTTGVVALRLNRRYLGLELNEKYCDLSRQRIIGDAPLWNGDAL